MIPEKIKNQGRIKRKRRIRKKMGSSEERPRLLVFRSHKHMYAQIVVDSSGKVLTGVSTLSKGIKGTLKSTGNIEAAKEVGLLIAKKAIDKGISKVAFDRNGFHYHGRIKALAVAAREGGLKF